VSKIRFSPYYEIIDKVKVTELWNKGYRGLLFTSIDLDTKNIEAIEQIGFKWKNLPDYCSSVIARFTFENQLINLVKQTKKKFSLEKKVVLVIGSDGNIGSKMCELAKKHKCMVLKYDIKEHTSLDLILPLAEIIILCVPLDMNTKNYFSKKQLENMTKKPIILNPSGRIDLIDLNLMAEMIAKKFVSGYACDEMTNHWIKESDRCYFTNHIATREPETQNKKMFAILKAYNKLEKELNKNK